MLSVLYVDDERDLLELGKIFLEQSPEFHVAISPSAKDALASPAFSSYDAIVSDYQMPEMDGIAFLKAVRQRYGDVPFILFTGRGREDVVIEAINNGVDFYLQKGGEVKAQFAELSHKIRQSVARRQAEHSLVESEKRLGDIIDFLPDATFAIDRKGIIIAWNRAIEEMTGVPAAVMLGKGDHEYSIPFYGERRPILIDLVSAPEDEIARYYTNMLREGVSLTAETDHPHPKGTPITVLAKASPLYDREGQVNGAIEAIRDITERKRGEDELRAAYEQITASEEELRGQLDVLEESEKKIRESEARLRYMIGFYEKAKGPERELLEYAVEGAGAVTGSPLGYLAFLNDDETELSMYAWSRSAMEECRIRNKPIVYKTEQTGLWGEAVRQRRAVITNDYAAPNPAKKGLPDGHPGIVRHMNVPVIDGDHIVLVAGVANKPVDYSPADVRELTLLMQSLWLVIKRRRTEEALLESEEKYRDLFENSVIGIFRTTLEGTFSAINTTFARISGYESATEMMEAIGDIRTQLYVHPEDRDHFVHALKTDGFIKDFAAEYYHRDGHAVWILINARSVSDSKGTVRYYEGTIEDITARKKAEEALLREKTFSDAVLESIPGLLYLYDSEGRLVRWNKAHESITGYSPEELAGMHLIDWYRGDDDAIATITDGIGRAMRNGQATAEAKLQTKSGKQIPFFFTAKRLEIEGKTYFTGVGIDMTDRQREQDELRAAYEQITASEEELRGQLEELSDNQAALKASEEKFRDLVETSPDIIWEMDGQGVLRYISPQSLAVMGYPPEEVAGRNIFSFVPDDALAYVREIFIASVVAKKPPSGFDLPIRCRNGHIITVEIWAVALLDPDGRVKGFRGVARDITEKKKTSDELRATYEQLMASDEELRGQYDELANSEKRIRESEERYRNVIDFSPFGMHFYALHEDGSLIFTGSNPAADTILRVDNSQFIGRTIEEAFPALTQTEIPDQYRRVARTGDPWQTEQVTYDNGTISGAFSVSAFQIRPGVMAATFFDITQRKQAEESLREKTEEINQYFTTSLDLYCIADTEGHFLRLNPEWEKTLWYTLAELEGKHFIDLVHPDDLTATLASVAALSSQKEVLNFTNRYRHKDGTYRWLEWRSIPKGNLIYASARDITTRISAEKALQETERNYRTLVENSQSIIYTIRPDGILTFVSPSWTKLLGHDPAEVVDHDFRSFVHRDDMAACNELLQKTIEGRTMQPGIEYRVFHKDGSIRWHRSNITPVFDDQNHLVSFVGNAVDITERHSMENAIREANHKLTLLNSITRHDVANQLTILQGYAQIAAVKKGDPVMADYLAKILTAADIIAHQVEFTRTYQELGVKAPAWTSLEEIITHVESRVPVRFSGTCRGGDLCRPDAGTGVL